MLTFIKRQSFLEDGLRHILAISAILLSTTTQSTAPEVQATKINNHYNVNNIDITSKALLVKAFLQMNLKSCPTHIKLKCYDTYDKTYSRICQSCLVLSHKER